MSSAVDAALQRLEGGDWTADDFLLAVESAAAAPPGSDRREKMVTAAVGAVVADYKSQQK